CVVHFGFVEEGFRVVEFGGNSLVTHFLDHDHGRFLVEHLVDGDHLAKLHQMLDDFGRLHCHLVGEIGHRDGFRHVHFTRDEFLSLRFAALRLLIAISTPTARLALAAGAPSVTAGCSGCGRFLGGRLLATALFLPGAGLGGLGATLDFTRLGVLLALACRLVQRAGNPFGFRCLEDLARAVQHGTQGRGFCLGRLARTLALFVGSARGGCRAAGGRSRLTDRRCLGRGRTRRGRLFRRLRGGRRFLGGFFFLDCLGGRSRGFRFGRLFGNRGGGRGGLGGRLDRFCCIGDRRLGFSRRGCSLFIYHSGIFLRFGRRSRRRHRLGSRGGGRDHFRLAAGRRGSRFRPVGRGLGFRFPGFFFLSIGAGLFGRTRRLGGQLARVALRDHPFLPRLDRNRA